LVANDLGVDPKKCLVFEDVIQGVMGGKNANMKVCAVYDEFSEKDDQEKKRLSDYYIYSMKEIIHNK
jgi:beta-phosphoglucomutase-like phosphatase (HAD superfamily)